MRIAALSTVLLLGLSAAAHASETVTYTYDARGRLVTVVHSGTVNNGITTSYSPSGQTLDQAGNRVQVTTTGASH